MTERQAYRAMAVELPADARIEVRRDCHVQKWLGGERRTIWWEVDIHHEASGYIKRHTTKCRTAARAVKNALAKWRAYQREVEETGVPRWVPVPKEWPRAIRVRIACGRLFHRDDDEPREVAYITGGDEVLISAAVPLDARSLVLEAALAADRSAHVD